MCAMLCAHCKDLDRGKILITTIYYCLYVYDVALQPLIPLTRLKMQSEILSQ